MPASHKVIVPLPASGIGVGAFEHVAQAAAAGSVAADAPAGQVPVTRTTVSCRAQTLATSAERPIGAPRPYPHESGGALEPVVLSEELFRSIVVRERRRADRFDQGFALATVALHDGAAPGRRAALPAAVIDAVTASVRQTDAVGWVEEPAVLGVMYAEVASAPEAADELRRRLQRELDGAVNATLRPQLLTQWYVHDVPGTRGTFGLADDDPLRTVLHRTEAHRLWRHRSKRLLDVTGSGTLLVLLAPLFLVIAALIRLTTPGSVLFRQVRIGHLGRPFTMFKFRSMYAEADTGVHKEYVTAFIRGGGAGGVDDARGEQVFKLVKDTRVTPIGRMLRRTSLDELPQLWNVFRGDMSLVGPRPPLAYELEQYSAWHWRRVLEAKPGVTGLWQVTGRSRTTFDEMVRLDVRYGRSQSLWSDIRILLATPRAVISGRGAC